MIVGRARSATCNFLLVGRWPLNSDSVNEWLARVFISPDLQSQGARNRASLEFDRKKARSFVSLCYGLLVVDLALARPTLRDVEEARGRGRWRSDDA